MNSATESSRSAITRRQALKRGAAVGALAAWTVPTIQAVSLTAAHADSASAPPPHNPPPEKPPVNPPAGHTPKPSTPKPKPVTKPAAPAGSVPAGSVGGTGGTTAGGKLAETGLTLPLVPTVAVAAGLIATGIAAQAARPEPAVDPLADWDPDNS
jgi:hypothetical protein